MSDHRDPTRAPEIRVWIMRPKVDAATGGVSFPWDWSALVPEGRLIPQEGTRLKRSMGTASFHLLRQIRIEARDNGEMVQPSVLAVGAYVVVTSGPVTVGDIDPAAVDWWGFVSSISGDVVAGTTDMIGTVQALEVGHLFDSMQVQGWSRQTVGSTALDVMMSAPTANIGTASGEVVGNAIQLPDVGVDSHGDPVKNVFAFARKPADCGVAFANVWTKWRLLRHLAALCRPTALPTIYIRAFDNAGDPGENPLTPGNVAGFLNDSLTLGFNPPQVYDLRRLTWAGALDMCIPASSFLSWVVDLTRPPIGGGVVWKITAMSDLGAAAGDPITPTYQMPWTVATDVAFSAETPFVNPTRLTITKSSEVADQIIVDGAPIVHLVNLSYADLNWKEAWTTGTGSQQEGYENAPVTERGNPEHQDVFTLFRVISDSTTDDLRTKIPTATGGTDTPMVPKLNWNGDTSTLTIDTDTSRAPYLPTTRLCRTLPWPEGLKSDGTDTRGAVQKSFPTYLKPQIYLYDSTAPTSLQWVPLGLQGYAGYKPFQLDVDERGCGLKIHYSPPHVIGYGTFGTASFSPWTDGSSPEYDYRKLVATVAIPSDQRVRVSKLRPGVSDLQIRKQLVVCDEDLQCWIARLGVMVGVKVVSNVTTADVVTATNFDASKQIKNAVGAGATVTAIALRNDYQIAQTYCNQLAAWGFHKRNAVDIEIMRPAVTPTWAAFGTIIGYVSDDGSSTEIPAFTGVESITYTWGDHPRISIRTDMPAQPTRAGSSSASPAAGGQISPSIGGTVPQAVQSLQRDVTALTADAQRMPVIIPRSDTRTLKLLQIVGGNSLAVTGNAGVKRVTTAPTSIIDYDITTSPTCVDGIGYARDIVTGTLEMIGNFPPSLLPTDLWAGDVILCLSQTSVLITSSSPARYRPVWVPSSVVG